MSDGLAITAIVLSSAALIGIVIASGLYWKALGGYAEAFRSQREWLDDLRATQKMQGRDIEAVKKTLDCTLAGSSRRLDGIEEQADRNWLRTEDVVTDLNGLIDGLGALAKVNRATVEEEAT